MATIISIQTRSNENGTQQHKGTDGRELWEEVCQLIRKDPTIWKVSYIDIYGKDHRWVNYEFKDIPLGFIPKRYEGYTTIWVDKPFSGSGGFKAEPDIINVKNISDFYNFYPHLD